MWPNDLRIAIHWGLSNRGACRAAARSGGSSHTVTEQFVTGDIGYVLTGAGHYIRNTGSGILRFLLGFNDGRYRSHDLNACLASNPPDVLATNLGLPLTIAEALPKEILLSHERQRNARAEENEPSAIVQLIVERFSP